MAFAAIHPEAGRIDATLSDLGCGLTWSAVHKARPRVGLRCPDCGHGVHAKVSARKLRYFAHNPGRTADCAWLNESLEHHLLKLELATSIREAGWNAQLEVRAPDGSWRADVLATSHDGGRRIAWEAQLSPITDDDIAERTARYQAEGIEVCWVGIAPRALWIGIVPSVRVREPYDDRPWTVVDGVAGFAYSDGAWSIVDSLTLITFIRWILQEKMIIHDVGHRYRRVRFGHGQRYARRPMLWTTPRSIANETRHEAMRQRQDEQKRQAEQRRQEQAEADRQEEQRLREVREMEERIRQEEHQARMKEQRAVEDARWEKRRAADRARRDEQQRQQAIAAERQRQRQEAVEQERRRQEHHEQLAADQWWAELSAAQVEQLRAAVAEQVRKEEATHIEFDSRGPTADYGHGVAIFQHHRLHGLRLRGIIRPSPRSAHRIPQGLQIFMRNDREARLIENTGKIESHRVVHLNLPEGEQLSLM